MDARPEPRRFRRLRRVQIEGRVVPIAASRRARLLGLALLDRRRAGAGLLIPRCRSVHTFGMRFPLDLIFLGDGFEPLSVRYRVGAGRLAFESEAIAVLELPAGERP